MLPPLTLTWWQQRLSQRPLEAWAFTLASIVGVVALDYLTGPELSFFLFYLAPVALASWLLGRWGGLGMALLSALLWWLVDNASGYGYSSKWIPLWNSVIRLFVFVGFSWLLFRLKSALDRESRLAVSDPLTQLFNRRAFAQRLDSEIERGRRYGEIFTLAYFDLDNFKQVNDTLGHEVGDRLLCRVAETLHQHTRVSDVAARLGGDEFGVLFPQADIAAGGQALNKLREALCEAMEAEGWPVTVSIGAITFSRPPGSTDEALGLVDALMYRVKHGGKNGLELQSR